MESANNYLQSTYFFDFEHPNIENLVKEFQTDKLSKKEKAVQLYLKIRDGWRYDFEHLRFEDKDFKASTIAKRTGGHCIDKAILLVAGLRNLGIPARTHFAKVKNHIAIESIIERIGTDELTPHGMVDIFLDGKWVKASPAFNATLCERCNVDPLDFDGENDSIFQQYNREGNQFMEYLEDYGHYEDLPLDFIRQNMVEHYPYLINKLTAI